MRLEQIKECVDAGIPVHWMNTLYEVIKDRRGEYLIRCTENQCCWGLTHKDGTTMNGSPGEFYVPDTDAHGDNVWCGWCSTFTVVPNGSDKCDDCGADGALQWAHEVCEFSP